MRQTEVLKKLKASLVPGKVYRRANLTRFSSNIDRYLSILVHEEKLEKLSQGLYTVPKNTIFGKVRPESDSLLKSFLKDDHFVAYGP